VSIYVLEILRVVCTETGRICDKQLKLTAVKCTVDSSDCTYEPACDFKIIYNSDRIIFEESQRQKVVPEQR